MNLDAYRYMFWDEHLKIPTDVVIHRSGVLALRIRVRVLLPDDRSALLIWDQVDDDATR